MSTEEIKNFVTQGYTNILKREPDPTGLRDFTGAISSGRISKELFIQLLKNSQEYINKFGQKEINFFQNFPPSSGYGILGSIINNSLINNGYEITNIGGPHLGRFNVNTPYSYISLILSTPLSFFKAHSKITIGYTMFEANQIPTSWISGCNTVDRLFVPIISNIDTFKRCGVNVPIYMIPIGVDANIYNPVIKYTKVSFCNDVANSIINNNNIYKFLVINEGQARKNNQIIIDAFHQEFAKEIEKNNVYLIIRTQNQYQGRNILWIDRYINDSDMPLFINSCDCMVNVSSGECGDIPIVEGMAMEKPVIVSNDNLVHTEIIEDRKTGFLVDIERMETAFKDPSYTGASYLAGITNAEWVIPSINSLKTKMRYVYDNRETSKEIGRNARQYVLQNRTIDISIQKMINVFEKL